ncbi:class E sortase [Streptomyces sp. NPDC049879]|uniref:class E sortase n=1 Tax=Streptomyces sp. NPDC049879 TaxID=3365598 RepID=UPI0037BCF63D
MPSSSEPPPAATGPADSPENAEDTENAENAENAEDTDSTEKTDSTDSPPPRVGAARRRIAAAVGVAGELLITAGAVLALFVVYSLWWTNVVADREARQDSDAVREHWAAEGAPDGEDTGAPRTYDPEDGIGFLHVPAMTGDEILVKAGTGLDILNGGVAGYYEDPVESAMPWDEEGNFSLAAHRDGHGARFHAIDHIEEGDPIVFETQNTWYVYRAFAILPETSKYNTDVLAPVPEESGATEAGRYITLTTCTPVYTSRHRFIVWGELERTEPVDADRTPPEELRNAS